MEQKDLKKLEVDLKQWSATLGCERVELNREKAEISLQQAEISVEQQKFDREINRQELLRRAIEVASNACVKAPEEDGLKTLLKKATEKLTQSIEAL